MGKEADEAYKAGFTEGRKSAIFVISTYASNGQHMTHHAEHVDADGGGFHFTAPEGYLITRVCIDAAAGPKRPTHDA
jgi:hypothetical protein